MNGPNPSGLCQCGCGQPTNLANRTDRQAGTVSGLPQRFLLGHHARVMWQATHADRVRRWLARCTIDDNGCWIWTGAKASHGYSHVVVLKPDGSRVSTGLHRVVYEHLVGPVPAGLELDHLCRVPLCCNPAHLEPVTHRENVLRGDSLAAARARITHCPQGHEYTPENTAWSKRGQRSCRECGKGRDAARYQRNKNCARTPESDESYQLGLEV